MQKLFVIIFLGLLFSVTDSLGQRKTSVKKSTVTPVKKTTSQKPDAVKGIQADDVLKKNTDNSNTTNLLQTQEDTLTEQQAEDNLAKLPKAVGDSLHSYRIIAEDVSWISACPGTTISVPFSTVGPFDEGNTFVVHLIDPSGKSVPISLPLKKGPLRAVIPSYKIGGEMYRIQIISTIPIVRSQEIPIRLLQTPSARLEVNDGTQSVRIMPGQEAHLRVNLTGTAPWSFKLSDSTIVKQTLSNPHYLTVKPSQVRAYKLLGVANACGSGTISGETIINVDDNPEPKLELKDVEKITRVCTGIPFQVPFAATGKFKSGNRFVVQIADRSGAYKTISSADTSGALISQIPASYKPGDYKLRVTASAPYLVSQPANISIVAATVAVLQKDSLHLEENGAGYLTVKFEGASPWFILLSDGTYENNIMESPYKVRVKPFGDTQYQITSAGGLCGVGKFSGKTKVTMDTPPVAITLEKLPQNMVCAGSTIEIPYKIAGRFNPGNKFSVQITDKSGRFVDVPTTVTPTTMKVKVTSASQGDTIRTQRVRILSSSPAVSSAVEEIDIIAPDRAVGEVSGKAFITPGRSTRIQLKFRNGLPPWSFTLSDGTAITGTFLNPYLISVSPSVTTTYTISSLKSGCGTGAGKGTAVITVDK
jgi:urease beta subunit